MRQRFSKKVMILLFTLLVSISWAKSKDVKVFTERSDTGVISFYARNDKYCPVTVKLEFTKFYGFKKKVEQSFFLIPARSDKFLIQVITPQDDKRQYFFNNSYYLGDTVNFRQDKDIAYLLPWAHGEKHRLAQGHNGSFTHKGYIRNALDFTMEDGTAIHAALDGIVIKVVEHFTEGGVGDQYINKGNKIIVYQKDGSFAEYVHLRKNGALVYVGQKVKAGQKIGLSGNTGYSMNPHLHFCVFRPQWGGWDSIPTLFRDHKGRLIDLKQGEWYYSTHPGKAGFEVLLGRDITDADFKGFSKAAKIKDKIKMHQLKIDSTYMMFAENGYDRDISMTVTFISQNMTVSKGKVVTVKVPAKTRVYVQLMRPDGSQKKSTFTYKYTYEWLE